MGNLGLSWGLLQLFCGHLRACHPLILALGPLLGLRQSLLEPSWGAPGAPPGVVGALLEPFRGSTWSYLGRSWSHLDVSGAPRKRDCDNAIIIERQSVLEVFWHVLLASWVLSWTILGPLGAILGPLAAVLGPSLGHPLISVLGPLFGPLGALLEPSSGDPGAL